jgi:hypothetical protein
MPPFGKLDPPDHLVVALNWSAVVTSMFASSAAKGEHAVAASSTTDDSRCNHHVPFIVMPLLDSDSA